MEVNLNVTLNAYPKLSSTLLADYVTKEELEAKDYVDNDTLDTTLADYVKDVVDADPSVVYGRKEVNGVMTWVPITYIDDKDQPFCYGMTAGDTLTSEGLQTLQCVNLPRDISSYLVEYLPSTNGYFWFCSPRAITKVVAASGLSYEVTVTEQPGTISLIVEDKTYNMNCYKTTRLAALPGVPYKFEIELGD